jgi:hypothetical protein
VGVCIGEGLPDSLIGRRRLMGADFAQPLGTRICAYVMDAGRTLAVNVQRMAVVLC